MNIGTCLLTALKESGAKALFGLPGDYVLPFFNIIEEEGILPLYTLSHEPAVGFAADGASRHGGGVGVAVVTYGAGAMNLVNAAACAWAEHSPLVIISGAPGTKEMDPGLMLHHQIRTPDTQLNVFKEFTCDQAILNNPETASEEIARVLHSCVMHSRPVYIEIPRDMPSMHCPLIEKSMGHEDKSDQNNLNKVVKIIKTKLEQAKNPSILAGIQVRRRNQEEKVYSIARHWNLPLMTSFMGTGMFSDKGFPYIGNYVGLAGKRQAQTFVEESDFLLMLGVIISDTNWGGAGKHINPDNIIDVRGDRALIDGVSYDNIRMKDLINALSSITYKHKAWEISDEEAMARSEVRMDWADIDVCADDVAPAIQYIFSKKGVMPVSVDVGDCMFMAMSLENVPILASGYYATMGFGVPVAIGAQSATGDRPLVITGDGGFQMTGWELINCARYGLDPIIIVLNNQSWEMLRQFQPEADYTKLGQASYSKLADNLGGHGVVVNTQKELVSALEDAINERGKFQLIEVMLKAGDCSSSLRNFASALKQNMGLNKAA